ncbi:MAG: hypothetical protein ACTSW1_06725 [Candidatus Hodarchaeales archaeon]
MKRHRIEIIGLDGEKFYSLGMVEVDSKQNVYALIKLQKGVMKTSRHASGEYHNELILNNGEKTKIGSHKRVPISDLKGIETIKSFGMPIFGLEEIFNEYQLKKAQGIFCIDLREYKEGSITLTFQIVKRDAFPDIINAPAITEKKQAYIYAESDPIISLFAFTGKPIQTSKHPSHFI